MPPAKRAKRQPKEMEPPTNVGDVYLHVVEDVIQSVRDDFHKEGVDDGDLLNLRMLWELNLMKSGVGIGAGNQGCGPASKGASSTPFQQLPDLNVTYGIAAEYQTLTGKQVPILFQNNPPVANESTSAAAEDVKPDIQRGKLNPYVLQRTPWMTQKTQRAADLHGVVKEEFQEKDEAEFGQASVGKHSFTAVKEEKE